MEMVFILKECLEKCFQGKLVNGCVFSENESRELQLVKEGVLEGIFYWLGQMMKVEQLYLMLGLGQFGEKGS